MRHRLYYVTCSVQVFSAETFCCGRWRRSHGRITTPRPAEYTDRRQMIIKLNQLPSYSSIELLALISAAGRLHGLNADRIDGVCMMERKASCAPVAVGVKRQADDRYTRNGCRLRVCHRGCCLMLGRDHGFIGVSWFNLLTARHSGCPQDERRSAVCAWKSG